MIIGSTIVAIAMTLSSPGQGAEARYCTKGAQLAVTLPNEVDCTSLIDTRRYFMASVVGADPDMLEVIQVAQGRLVADINRPSKSFRSLPKNVSDSLIKRGFALLEGVSPDYSDRVGEESYRFVFNIDQCGCAAALYASAISGKSKWVLLVK